MSEDDTALSLVGKPLGDFSVKAMTEVYKTNDDGKKQEVVGYFFDPRVAQAWIDGLEPMSRGYHGSVHVLMLTDGVSGFLLDAKLIPITDDEVAKLEIRNKALAKLTPSERSVLGL